MKNISVKYLVGSFVTISAVAWIILAWRSDKDLSQIKDFLSLVPKVISIDVAIFGIFAKWGWRWKFFRGWLVPFADLNGTWIGNIHSDWIDPSTEKKIAPIPAMLTIKQTFLHISCVMHTGEMKSHSYSESFLIDADKQIKALAYIYTSKPRISLNQRSVPHDGAVYFEIIEKPNRVLKGHYWSERKTTGEMIFDFKTKDLLEQIPKDIGVHPVSEK